MVAVKSVGAICGGILVLSTFGTLYTFGNMAPYMVSYMRQNNVSEVTYGETVWIPAMTAAGQGLTITIGGYLETFIGTRASILIGSWGCSISVILTYFSLMSSYPLTVVTYGFLFGALGGMSISIPMACAMRWFPRHRGLVTGAITAGFGGGAFIFNYVQTAYINPQNLRPDLTIDGETYFGQDDVLDRVPQCMLLLGGVYAVIQLVGVVMISNPPGFTFRKRMSSDYRSVDGQTDKDEAENEKTALLDSGIHEGGETSGTDDLYKSDDTSGLELSPSQVLRRSEFYKLWFTFLLNSAVSTFISTLYKAFGLTFIRDDLFLATVGSSGAGFNAVGRIIWGLYADRFSFRIAMMTLCGCMVVLLSTLPLTPLGGKPMFFIWVCTIFLVISGNFCMFPTVVSRAFGHKYMVQNYGLIFASQIVAGPVGAILAAELTERLGWNGTFFMLAGLSAPGLVLIATFRVKRQDGSRDV